MILFHIATATTIAFTAAAVCVCVKIFFVCRLLSLCLQLFVHLFKSHKTVAYICQPSFHPSPSPAIINFATSLFYTIFHTLQPDVGIPCSLPL